MVPIPPGKRHTSNLGNVLAQNGQLEEAASAYRQSIALRRNYAEAHSNLGNVLDELGQLDEAIAAYRQAIALKPDFAGAHNNIALALLSRGRFSGRLGGIRMAVEMQGFPVTPSEIFTSPSGMAGRWIPRTILIHAEQGFWRCDSVSPLSADGG